jgi:hypothetical protein
MLLIVKWFLSGAHEEEVCTRKVLPIFNQPAEILINERSVNKLSQL